MSDIGRDNAILTYKSQRMPLDKITGGVGVTDTNHSQVHAGAAFHYSEQVTLGNGGVRTVTIDVPAGEYVHFQGYVASLAQSFSIDLVEGDTPTTGTEVTPIARNRVKNIASALTLHDTAVTANTTNMSTKYIAAGRDGGFGVASEGIEWVLEPGKSYTFTITNETTTSASGYIAFDWYEEGAGQGERMKCLTCIHYDVVNLTCKHLQEKFELSEPPEVPMDWYCADYADATMAHDKLKIDITIKL